MPHATWILGSDSHVGIAERGNAVLDPGPIGALNGACMGNNVIEMRQGMSPEDLTGSGFTGPVLWIGRFVTNQGVEELWAAANNGGTAVMARKVGGVWSPVAFSDTPNAPNLIYMQGVGMNGKFFLAYDSNVNRLHVWDGTGVRRVGFVPATAPTVAEQGAGSLSFTRYYRQRNVAQVSGVNTRLSEPSSAVAITIASKLGVTVTKSAASGDGETHWVVEAASAAAGPWYQVTLLPIGTTTYSDTNATIPTATPSAELGGYDPPPSAKYLSTDGLSLMMGGAWETTATAGQTIPKQNRVWFTPPLGTTDIGDDERINNTTVAHGWLDVGDAGPITALQGPLYGETYATKKSTIAKLTPTGNVDAPYAVTILANAIGCVDQRLMTLGEVSGTPAIMFADANAVYALTAQGGIGNLSEPLGITMRDLTVLSDPGLLVYDPRDRTMLFITSHVAPAVLGTYRNFVFDTYKRRWEGFMFAGAVAGWVLGVNQLGIDTVLGGGGAEIHNGCFAEQNGERRLYLCGQSKTGQAAITSRGGQAVLDITEPFTTQVRYRKVFKPGFKATIGCPTVYYVNPMGNRVGELTLTVGYVRDFTETRSQSVVLPPTDYSSRIDVGVHTFEGVMSADATVLDVTLAMRYEGEPYQAPVTPHVACMVIPFTTSEALAQ